MSYTNAFPILYLNLGGELVYIIEQRLQAQNVAADKAKKVLNDILSTMLNRQFIADMFRPGGQLSPPSSMKALLEKVVHASIMRLGQESLDKLFDLMFMAVKFQLFSAPVPSQLLFITLVHVESWTLMTQDPEIIFLIQNVQNLLINNFKNLSPWAWMSIRHCLLNYFQPNKTRVTIFLKKEVQNQTTGYFHLDFRRPIPEGTPLPQLESRHHQQRNKPPYDFPPAGPSDVIQLGSNMFNETKKAQQRPRTSHTLEGILVQPSSRTLTGETADSVEDTRPDFPSGAQWESLQLQLMDTERPEAVTRPEVKEETLLDLFDEATHLLD